MTPSTHPTNSLATQPPAVPLTSIQTSTGQTTRQPTGQNSMVPTNPAPNVSVYSVPNQHVSAITMVETMPVSL